MKTDLTHHGGMNTTELDTLGINPKTVIDFSTNINAYGPCPGILSSFSETDIMRYPDKNSNSLRAIISQKENVAPDQLLIGNGSSELIWLTAFRFLSTPQKVLILNPTFSEYERCAALMRASIIHANAEEKFNFQHQPDTIDEMLKSSGATMCFICTPNNPSGVISDPAYIQHLAKKHPATLFVIDEAYLAFVPDLVSSYNPKYDNLLILRSLTKEYALAGLRPGYILGNTSLIKKLTDIRPAWNINSLAQKAGELSLKNDSYLNDSVKKLLKNKHDLVADLGKIGVRCIPSATHYFLCKVGDASQFRQRLLTQHHIQVRDCTSFGLPAYIRIGTRKPAENQKLLTAMKDLIK